MSIINNLSVEELKEICNNPNTNLERLRQIGFELGLNKLELKMLGKNELCKRISSSISNPPMVILPSGISNQEAFRILCEEFHDDYFRDEIDEYAKRLGYNITAGMSKDEICNMARPVTMLNPKWKSVEDDLIEAAIIDDDDDYFNELAKTARLNGKHLIMASKRGTLNMFSKILSNVDPTYNNNKSMKIILEKIMEKERLYDYELIFNKLKLLLISGAGIPNLEDVNYINKINKQPKKFSLEIELIMNYLPKEFYKAVQNANLGRLSKYLVNKYPSKLDVSNLSNVSNVTPMQAYGDQSIEFPRYRNTGRPKSEMTFMHRSCIKGDYLPVIRYQGLYYSSTSTKNKYCGKFYYYEPNSSTYLYLGNHVVFGNKIHAFLNLYKGSKAETIKHLGKLLGIKNVEKFYSYIMKNSRDLKYDHFNLDIGETILNSLYEKDNKYYGDHFMAKTDILDQPICKLAKTQGYDTVILQREPGETRMVTEVLDTRINTTYYGCTLNESKFTNYADASDHPTIWFEEYGFVKLPKT